MAVIPEAVRQAAMTAIDSSAADLHALSDDIWRHPELDFEEKHAHDALCDFLEKQGFSVERHLVLDTAFRATVGEKTDGGAHVAVLCEYDALPGIGHACGHNLIAEVGVAAGLAIKAAMHAAGPDRKLGKVSVIGTPAEEGGGGKNFLLKAGIFQGCDLAMMAHPFPVDMTDSSSVVCRKQVNVTYRGKAVHAAAAPWEGVNALDAAVMAYQNISVMRQQFKPSWRVHGIISNGGVKPNIIPEESSLEYYVRAQNLPELNALQEKTTAAFQAAAVATGCQVDIEWKEDMTYLNIISNQQLLKVYEKYGEEMGVVFTKASTFGLGSTDFGNVTYEVPGIHPEYKIGDGSVLNHTRPFTDVTGSAEAQGPTLQTAKMLALTAIEMMLSAESRDKMRTDFQQDMIKYNAK